MWQMFFSLLSELKVCVHLPLHSRHRAEIMSGPSEEFILLHKHSHIYSMTVYIHLKKYASDSSASANLA